MIKECLHKIRLFLIFIIKGAITVIPKDKNLILFSAWNGQRYADSSMYMFEYMLKDKSFKVIWFTKSKGVYVQLKQAGLPVVYSKSLIGIWKQIRAIMLVSSIQLADFNPYLLKNCIYYDLGHGFPIKESGFEQPDCTQHFIDYTMAIRKGIKYYMPVSSAFTREITCRAFNVSVSQLAFCTFPRIDVFYDEKLREGVNENLKNIIRGKKVISYLPTHRAMGKDTIRCSEIFDLQQIQNTCEKYNAVFLIKKHFFHSGEKENVSKLNRVFDITNEPVETQSLLYETDVLVTDYSACSIDFSLLDRPMIIHAFDLETFLKTERNLYVPFEKNNAGEKTYTKDDFNKALEKVLQIPTEDKFKEGREELKRRYFDEDCPIGNSRSEIVKIIKCMIEGTYKNKWEEH